MQTWSISGVVSVSSGTTLILSGAASASTAPDASGNYSFNGLPNGAYTVTPSNAGVTFSPANQSINLNGANASGINFTGTAKPTWSISGTISPAALGGGSLVSLSGSQSAATNADGSGNYIFNNLTNGSYTVTPSSDWSNVHSCVAVGYGKWSLRKQFEFHRPNCDSLGLSHRRHRFRRCHIELDNRYCPCSLYQLRQ